MDHGLFATFLFALLVQVPTLRIWGSLLLQIRTLKNKGFWFGVCRLLRFSPKVQEFGVRCPTRVRDPSGGLFFPQTRPRSGGGRPRGGRERCSHPLRRPPSGVGYRTFSHQAAESRGFSLRNHRGGRAQLQGGHASRFRRWYFWRCLYHLNSSPRKFYPFATSEKQASVCVS